MRGRKRPKGRSARAIGTVTMYHCLICFSMDLKQVRGNTKEDVILVHAFHDGIVILVHLKNQLCKSYSKGEGLS